MQLRFNIDMRNPGIRNIALFLGGLALIRDGLDFGINGGTDRFHFNPDEEIFDIHILNPRPGFMDLIRPDLQFLSELGERVMEERQWQSLARGGANLFYDLLKKTPPSTDIKLVTLSTGSLDGVIDDLFDAIGSWFHRILGSSANFVEGEISEQVKSTFSEVVNSSDQPREIKNAGIGLVIIGVQVLATSYKAGDVRKVDVRRNS